MDFIYWPELCGNSSELDALWNPPLSLYTYTPDLTTCMHETLVTWLPAAICVLILPVYWSALWRRPSAHLPNMSMLLKTKLVVNGTLVLMWLSNIILAVINFSDSPTFIIQSCVYTTVFVLTALIHLSEYAKRCHTSPILLLLFTALVSSAVLALRSRVINIAGMWDRGSHMSLTTASLHLALVTLLWILAFPVDTNLTNASTAPPSEHTPLLEAAQPADGSQVFSKWKSKRNPLDTCSWLSDITWFWMYGMIMDGYTKALELKDLFELPVELKQDIVWERLNHFWKQELNTQRWPSMLRAVLRFEGRILLYGCSLRCLGHIVIFIMPFLLRSLLVQIQSQDPYTWKLYALCLCIIPISLAQTLLLQCSLNIGAITGIRVRSALISTIYRKVIRLSSSARQQTTVGQIVNSVSVDCSKVGDSFAGLIPISSIIPGAIAVIIFLDLTLGTITIVGMVFLLVVMVPFNGFLVGNIIAKLQRQQMGWKDERLKITNEALGGIKVLKLYAWEDPYVRKITNLRDAEMALLWTSNALYAFSGGVWFMATDLVFFVTYVCYVYLPGNVLTPDVAFMIQAFIVSFDVAIKYLASVLSDLAQAMTSLQRITEFLLLEEIKVNYVTDRTAQNADNMAMVITAGDFSWDSNTILHNIDVRVPSGQLVAIVGQVGAGKSSLISAFLGEMSKLQGTVGVKGSVATVPQESWIQNKTLRDNILFDSPMVKSRYNEVINACALASDLTVLVDGDRTEIGVKGINLSGGQKARVSLARAVYQDRDVYLLDDPLSAVDAHVGKHIFQNVLGPNGLLKHKTRFLVTNAINILPQVDQVIVMREGRIVQTGTFTELLTSEVGSSELFHSISNENSNKDDSLSGSDESIPDIEVPKETKKELSRLLSHQKRRQRAELSVSESANTAPPTTKLIQVEAVDVGSLSLALMRTMARAAGPTLLFFACFFLLGFVALSVFQNVWLVAWTEAPLLNNGTIPRSQTDMYVTVYGLGLLAQGVCICLALFFFTSACFSISKYFHATMLWRILHSPMAFFDTTPSGRILNRLSNDLDQVDSVLPNKGRTCFVFLAQILSTILTIIVISPVFTLVVIPVLVAMGLCQRAYTRTSLQLQRLYAVSLSPLLVHLDESVAGIESIRAYRRQDDFIDKTIVCLDQAMQPFYLLKMSMRWLAVQMQLLGIAFIFVATVVVASQAQDGMSGETGMALTLGMRVFAVFMLFIIVQTEVETTLIGAERLRDYCYLKTEACNENYTPAPWWPDQGAVSYQNYSTRYRPGMELVLNDISFDIRPGEKVGVVGRTGAGKSSLTLSLFRIIEAASGSISIDGVSIDQLALKDLRSRLTIIPQDPVVFSGTLRYNVDPSSAHADDVVWRALVRSHLYLFVQAAPGGLQYQCGEGGEALSVGQRQLLCLTRALLRRTRLLILDEATAAVDLETDSLIQDTIRTAFTDCTIITIAHRLHTVIDYDRIMVLDDGRLAEFDTPTALLANPESLFYQLAKNANMIG